MAVFGRFSAVLTALSMLMVFIAASQASSFAKSILDHDHQLIAVKKPAAISEPTVIMETNKGTIRIVIFKKDAPITAANFIDLVQKGFYNGLTFHRYEPGFLIEGGDPQGSGTGAYVDTQTKTERRIPLEVKPGLKHSDAGIVAMARTGDPNSASCQFYITLAAAPKLDGEYAVFGKVVDGMQTLMSLRKGDKIVHAEVKEPGSK